MLLAKVKIYIIFFNSVIPLIPNIELSFFHGECTNVETSVHI